MFGIFLPLNFNSPYKATQHHRFLAALAHDVVAVPARLSLYPARRQPPWPVLRYVNLMITMVLGGLWHGAAWTFVVWGALHGLYLCINHAWNNYGPRDRAAFRAPGQHRRVYR